MIRQNRPLGLQWRKPDAQTQCSNVGVDSGLPSLQGWSIGRGRLQAIAASQQTATLELMQRSDKVHACLTLHTLINSSDL